MNYELHFLNYKVDYLFYSWKLRFHIGKVIFGAFADGMAGNNITDRQKYLTFISGTVCVVTGNVT
jgi:hypothetical protein